MQITVKTLDSRTKLFTIPDECTVKEFKEHIASDVSIPPYKQRLIFRGKVLQDDKKLSEYGADGCVIHLVERKPQVAGANSQDGTSGSSSSSNQGNQPHGLGPNIVMGAISMPVDVVGATQQIVQNLVSQLGVDSAQANISTTSSDDGSSVNVHINLQATTQPGNDVLQRINLARHFMRAASCSLNRMEGEGVLPMETGEVPDSHDNSQAPSSTTEAGDAATVVASPASLAEILEEAKASMTAMQPTLDRYISLLGSNTPESLDPSEDTLPDRIAEAFHNLSHAYHALSDLTFNFRAPEPRRVSVLTSLSPHIPQLPLLPSFMGAPQVIPDEAAQMHPHQPQEQQQQQQQPQPHQRGQPQPLQGTNQNLRIHVNPQGGISFTTIISNLARPNSGGTSATQSTSSTTSTSGSRMSASADNGGTQETFSSSFGGQRTSVGTNTNGSSTSTSTQTAQPGLRTRIIIDDFIALISNVPASMAAAAAAAAGASGQVLEQSGSGIPLNQNTSQPSQSQGLGPVPVATGPPQPQPRPTSVPVGQTQGQGRAQAGPQGGLGPARPQPVSFGVLPGIHVSGARANHPDPSLPCQSFHFGPQVQHSVQQQQQRHTAQQSTPLHPGERSSPVSRPGTEPAAPAAARQEQQLPESGSQQTTIAPAAVQALVGMFSNLQNNTSGGVPTPPVTVPPSSSSAGVSTVNLPNEATRRPVPEGPQRQGAGSRSMMDLLLSVMADVQSHSQEGQSQTVSQLIQSMRNSGLNIQEEEGLVPALFQRLSTVLTVEDIMGVVVGSNAPYQQMQPALMVYMREDVLHGNDATFENINRGVEQLSVEIVDNIAESLRSVPVKEGIDIVASARSFLEFYIKNAADLVLNSEGNPNFAEYFRDHMRDLSAEFFTLLVFCFQDGMTGVEQLLRNKLPLSPLTADMDENAREMFLQLFLRHVHQMYLSRAYCGPRLSRFVIRFAESRTPPLTPPSESVSTAVKVQPAGEERETHDSDDSEIFGTPPSSLVASGEADRLPADCQKGTEEPDKVMVDDYSGDEWKSIMPEEWIPVITTDIVRQRRLPPQAPFSDAYISGLPPKRRKVADHRGVTSSEDCIPDVLRHAVAAAGATPITSVEDVSRAARENRALHRAYRREVHREVKARLDKDDDYRPDKFPQTRDYFDRDAQGN